MYLRIEFVQTPVEPGILILIPYPVEPDSSDLAVTGKQFGELVEHELMIGRPFTGQRAAGFATGTPHGIIVGSVPIDQRIVKMQPDALLVTLTRQLFENVAPERCRIDNIIRRLLRVEHRKAVVMPRGNAEVLCPGGLYIGYPPGRIEFGGIKSSGEFRIFPIRKILVIHYPFAVGKHTVKSPMNEYTELPVAEIFAVPEVLCCRDITLLCRQYDADTKK